MVQEGKEVKEIKLSPDEKMWAMLCHLSALAGFIIPFGNIIGPLIIWTLKKDEFPLVNDQGKEALNFQISILIYIFVSVILVFVAIGILALIAVACFSLVMTVIAGIKANEGVKYRYPLTIRFLD
ncbi:DUF4870 domain-containing protein [candidate division KSB1 bacterium]|nr:DUF4870 domain-containing protein [candidate division KSB1 bacterium]